MDAGLAWKRDLAMTPAVRAFRDHLGLAFHLPAAGDEPRQRAESGPEEE